MSIAIINQYSLRNFSPLVPYFPRFYVLSITNLKEEESDTKIEPVYSRTEFKSSVCLLINETHSFENL